STKPAFIIMKMPAQLLGLHSNFWCETDVRMLEGAFKILQGEDPKKLQELAAAAHQEGMVRTREFRHPAGKDLYIGFVWSSHHFWDGKPQSFWQSDWIDGFRLYGK